MSDLVERLRSKVRGLCTEDPADYGVMVSMADILSVTDRIEELKAKGAIA